MNLDNLFDENYRKEECYWGLKPSKLVLDILEYKENGNVLDLGCGEGRNSLFLAQNGFNVTGVDKSEEGIKKFLKLAKELDIEIEARLEDIVDFRFNKKFDIILSIATLQFLEKEKICKVIDRMKRYTEKNGLNVISVFSEDNPYKEFPYLFKKGELRDLYKDWKIIKYGEFITSLQRHGKNGRWHKHGIAKIISKRS